MNARHAIAAAVLAAIAAAVPFTLSASAENAAKGQRGFFNSPCAFTHRAMDDPIVFPGTPGASHSHDFFGNVSTDAYSTLDSMNATATTCRRAGDRAGYWVPTLYKGKKTVKAMRANVYYRTARRSPTSIEPFPAGLQVIAGDAKATGPQDPRKVRWGCTGEAKPKGSKKAPRCPKGTKLRLSIVFPDCWNGRDLDSADHKSHLTYATRIGGGLRGCPPSHPRAVPSLVLNVPYKTRGGHGLKLASGPLYTAHGDFFNAWEPAALEQLVHDCLNADVHCGPPN
jgi:Domain of unknown function (DUF1996)